MREKVKEKGAGLRKKERRTEAVSESAHVASIDPTSDVCAAVPPTHRRPH